MSQQITVPAGFVLDEYQREFLFPDGAMAQIWDRLQRRETFTNSQIFPYRVEFAAASQEGEFSPGELNIHHGPFLSVHGSIGEVTSSYRGLDYFYGSYVLSFRLVRLVKLEFIRDGNTLRLKLRSYVRPWFRPIWHFGNFLLWTSFRFSLR